MNEISASGAVKSGWRQMLRNQAYFAGGWHCADNGAVVEVTNPADGSPLGTVPNLDGPEIRRAVDAAHTAFTSWKKLLPRTRGDILYSWYQLIIANKELLASVITAEQGKPFAEAVAEIEYGARFARWFAEEANRLYGEMIPSHLPDRKLMVQREPVGVVAAITPWNFPCAMLTRKASAALAAGCSVIAVPSSVTPFSALALASLAQDAGMPRGVFSVVTGQTRKIVPLLCDERAVRAVSFTGSTQVGRLIAAQCASSIKRVTLELGGHAPFIVFADADLEAAVRDAIIAKFQTSGQDCLAANRIYVHADIYEAFVTKFTNAVQMMKTGSGFEPGVDIGPLISHDALAKCKAHVRDALKKGARVTAGGAVEALGGLFFEPTVLADVTSNMKIVHEETFGPVAALLSFDEEESVVEAANDTEYGLIAYVHTRDMSRAWRLSDGLEYGMVAVNTAQITGAPIPFGGVKQSGIGREGSRHGLDDFTELKYVCMKVSNSSDSNLNDCISDQGTS